MKRAQSLVLLTAAAAARPRNALAQTVASKLKLGVIPSDYAGQAYYADQLGIFKKHGLAVEMTALSNGAAVAAAVSSGAVDVGYASVIPLISGYDRGIPFTIAAACDLAIAASATGGLLAVDKASPIRSAKDLEDKTVAIDGLKNLAWLAVRNWIDTTGGASAKVRFVELPWWQMPAALQAHTVDAASTNQVSDPDIGKPSDPLRLLASVFGSIAPRFASGAWISTKGWIAANAPAAKAFATAMNEAAVWGNANHRESAVIVAKQIKKTPADVERAIRVTYATEITPQLLQPAIDVAVKYQLVGKSFRAEDLISRAAQA
jgi:NitT/TauT family transport system substrate-binding protein